MSISAISVNKFQLLGVWLRDFSAVRSLSTTSILLLHREACKVLVVGAGCGGCSMASKLSAILGTKKVCILEPANKHYYQPMLALIGGGINRLEESFRPMASVIPQHVKWIKEKAVEFDPKTNTVTTSSGRQLKYDVLIIATGIQTNFNKIPGLAEALKIPNGMVGSIYSPAFVIRTYKAIQRIQEGNAIFTSPGSNIKGHGGPQKIMYIAEHFFRRHKQRNKIKVIYNTGLSVLFKVKYYADALWIIAKKRKIEVNLGKNLIEVRPEANVAVFEHCDKPGVTTEMQYSMLHVTPPMSTPVELSRCLELVNADGYVDVNWNTLQHVKYKNVFAIGDCLGTPNAKAAAATVTQSIVLQQNIMDYLHGEKLRGYYNGYSACSILTGLNRMILAEFDYTFTPLETFPFKQNKERYSMFFVKKFVWPYVYWNLVLPGFWNGPESIRKLFKFGAKKK